MAEAAILQNRIYLCDSLIALDEIWHDVANWNGHYQHSQTLKQTIFQYISTSLRLPPLETRAGKRQNDNLNHYCCQQNEINIHIKDDAVAEN